MIHPGNVQYRPKQTDMTGSCHICLNEKGHFSKESIYESIDDQETNEKRNGRINSKFTLRSVRVGLAPAPTLPCCTVLFRKCQK